MLINFIPTRHCGMNENLFEDCQMEGRAACFCKNMVMETSCSVPAVRCRNQNPEEVKLIELLNDGLTPGLRKNRWLDKHITYSDTSSELPHNSKPLLRIAKP